jgi:low temperature requirement protein LtrA
VDYDEPANRAVRVSTLELFFDLVFVFTLTQFTRLVANQPNPTGLAKVVLLFSVAWYAYDSFAWLTNALALDVLAYRLLLLEGMAGFLVIALAIPTTFEGGGVAFGVAYLFVVVLHSGLYIRATSAGEARAMRSIAPFNLLVALLVLAVGIAAGNTQWALMVSAAALLWSSGLFIPLEGFQIAASHFVERHGLLVIIALGESIVALGAGAGNVKVGFELALIAVLGLALSTSLWWLYFGDEERIERAMLSTPPDERPRRAIVTYGYLHFFLLLGIVLVAAGLKKAIPSPLDQLSTSSSAVLATGTAVFVAADAVILRVLGIARSRSGAAAAVAALATVALGVAVSAAAEVAALAAIVTLTVATTFNRSPGLHRPGRVRGRWERQKTRERRRDYGF